MRRPGYGFFFQAEDGIRDLTVTGVQTCALPISQDGVLALRARPLAVGFSPRVGEVHREVLHVPGGGRVDAAPPALLHPSEDVVLDLHIPGEVVLPALDHGAGGGHGIAAALHLEAVEERPVGPVVAGVQLRPDRVTRLEVDDAIRPGAHGLEVGGGLAGLGALEGLEDVLRDDRARRPAEDNRPAWLGSREYDVDRVAVELLDPGDEPVLAGRGRRARRVGGELPREDHVVGREGLSVVPLDACPELPGYRPAVVGDATVLEARRLLGQRGDEAPIRVEAGQGLVEDARAIVVLDADGEMGVQDGRRLPPQHAQLAAPPRRVGVKAGFGWPFATPASASSWATMGP